MTTSGPGERPAQFRSADSCGDHLPSQEIDGIDSVRRQIEMCRILKLNLSSLMAQLAEPKPGNPSRIRGNLQVVETLLELAGSSTLARIEEEELQLSRSTSLATGVQEKLAGAANSRKTLRLLREALSRSLEATAGGDRQAAVAGLSLGKAFGDALLETVDADISALHLLLDIGLDPVPITAAKVED